MAKRMLDLETMEAQAALELPARELPLVTVVITNLLNNNTVEITVQNIDIAAQICAQLIATGNFACEPVVNQ